MQLAKYRDLPQRGKVMAEYIWVDASGSVRSKTKVSQRSPTSTLGVLEYVC